MKSTLVGSVFERTPGPSRSVANFSKPSTSTGFPEVKHRSQRNVQSSFSKRREANPSLKESTPSTVPSSLPSDRGDGDDWREQISMQNQAKVESMSPEEIEQERHEILSRFGDGVVDILKRAKLNRERQKSGAGPLEEVPLTSETPSARSTASTRASSPTSLSRKLRFAELTPDSVHVYESAPPSPRKKSILALPPPPTDEKERSGIVSIGSYSGKLLEEGTPEDIRQRFFPFMPADNPDLEWITEDKTHSVDYHTTIRFDLSGRLIRPSNALEIPSHLGLHHHAEGHHAGYTLEDVFLLVRSRVPAQRSAMLDVCKGIVGTLKEANTPDPGDDEELTALYAELREKTPNLLKQLLFTGLEALPERGNVGIRGIDLVRACIIGWEEGIGLDRLTGIELKDNSPTSQTDIPESVIHWIPITDVLPQLVTVLAYPPDRDLYPNSTTPAQTTLLSIVHRLAKYSTAIAEDIINTPDLVRVIVDTFLRSGANANEVPREAGSQSQSIDIRVIQFLNTVARASRSNAKELTKTGVPDILLKYVVLGIAELEEIDDNDNHHHDPSPSPPSPPPRTYSPALPSTLTFLTTLAKYGLFTSTASDVADVWRRMWGISSKSLHTEHRVRQEVVAQWLRLVNVWLICARDPHCTTPPHDIIWSRVVAWDWGNELISLFATLSRREYVGLVFGEVCGALASWLEGARVNCVQSGAKERSLCIEVLKPSFQPEKRLGSVLGKCIEGLNTTLDRLNAFASEEHQPPNLTALINDYNEILTHSKTITNVIRLWLACLPPFDEPPPNEPPFPLPFSQISQLTAVISQHNIWTYHPSLTSRPIPYNYNNRIQIATIPRLIRRELATLLYLYLRMARRDPRVPQDLWLAQILAILPLFQRGDESYAVWCLDMLVKHVGDPSWLDARGHPLPPEMRKAGGVELIRPFFVQAIEGSVDAEVQSQPGRVIAPLVTTPKSIQTATTLVLPTPARGSHQGGLPFDRDWVFVPLWYLLRPDQLSVSPILIRNRASSESESDSDSDAGETDVVRSVLFLANVFRKLLGLLKGIAARNVSMCSAEVIFGCMQVFMLEDGVNDSVSGDGEEVFRDGVVTELMTRLLQPFTYAAARAQATASLSPSPSNAEETYTPEPDLESIASRFLGPSTPFYQFYTDFVSLYDSISFAHPVFGKLLLPPTSMKYAIDFRKHLWNDFGHVLKSVKVPLDEMVPGERVEEYLYPVESDPGMVSSYLRALIRYGDGLEGFVRVVAVHHVASNIWPDLYDLPSRDGGTGAAMLSRRDSEKASMLLRTVVGSASNSVTREIVFYMPMGVRRRGDDTRAVFEDVRESREEFIRRYLSGLWDRLGPLFAEQPRDS